MEELEAGVRYRMPVGFGPSPSPRQRSDGTPWPNPMAHIETTAVSFLTEASYLDLLLPPGLLLDGEPVVTVEMMFISELQWLAGRGYNTLGVRFPAKTSGNAEVRGSFLSILWENRADPIITGREELGFAKLYCDLPPPRQLGAQRHFEASWEGHRFMEMSVSDLEPATPAPPSGDGLLHFRYMPGVGAGAAADAQFIVLTPPSPRLELIDHATGHGEVRFIESSWERLPTLAHIVNRLAELPMLEERGATVTTVRSDTSLHNHRTVEPS